MVGRRVMMSKKELACPKYNCDGIVWSIPVCRIKWGMGLIEYQCEKCGTKLCKKYNRETAS